MVLCFNVFNVIVVDSFWIPIIKWIPFLLVLANLIVAVIFVVKAWK